MARQMDPVDKIGGRRHLQPIWGAYEPSGCLSKVLASSRVSRGDAFQFLQESFRSISLAAPMRSG
eukprot:CAMPEP_0170604114 /NCGR_PEP_ID=MMETSP0224-20130122/19255_1 /TAXON_ID=285029 /ORGANISM="Togula jolla, Strain CCCM 725" /LENGTH=64 /DNA_ID=CAMNT_0010929005 /DNA_START=163 /DNA_END=357 /DNA_ORIENTATION=+